MSGAYGPTHFDYTLSGEKTRAQVPAEEPQDTEDRLYLLGAEFVFDQNEGRYRRDCYHHEEGRSQYRRTDYDDVPLQPRPLITQYRISDHPDVKSGQVYVT